MTEIDPSVILKDGDCIYFCGVKYQRVEPPKMTFELGGKFEIVYYFGSVYYRLELNDGGHTWYMKKEELEGSFLKQITDGETHRLLEGLWFNQVKKGKYDEPDCPDEPYRNVRAYWDEKDNPKPVDEVINRMVEERNSKKLWNMIRDELDYLGYDVDCCDAIVDLVEKWLPEPQSAAGSQNVNTELLVDGFNDAIRKMKEMLR